MYGLHVAMRRRHRGDDLRFPAYHGEMSALVDPTLAADLGRGTQSQKVDVVFAYIRRRGQSFYDERSRSSSTRCSARARRNLQRQTRCRWSPPCCTTSATSWSMSRTSRPISHRGSAPRGGRRQLPATLLHRAAQRAGSAARACQALPVHHRCRLLRRPVPRLETQLPAPGRAAVGHRAGGVRAPGTASLFINLGLTLWAAECRSNRRRSRCRQAAPGGGETPRSRTAHGRHSRS